MTGGGGRGGGGGGGVDAGRIDAGEETPRPNTTAGPMAVTPWMPLTSSPPRAPSEGARSSFHLVKRITGEPVRRSRHIVRRTGSFFPGVPLCSLAVLWRTYALDRISFPKTELHPCWKNMPWHSVPRTSPANFPSRYLTRRAETRKALTSDEQTRQM